MRRRTILLNEVVWPSHRIPNSDGHEEFNALEVLCFACRDLLVAACDKSLAEYDSDSALTTAERTELVEAIERKLLDLEYEESALIVALEASGKYKVERRFDMHPLAALQIEVDDGRGAHADDEANAEAEEYDFG